MSITKPNVIAWNPSFSVDIQEIDEQHKNFFAIIHRIYQVIESGSPEEESLSLLSQLGGYAHYHLSTEEEYFIKFHYEGKEGHILAHDAFREKIKKMTERYRAGQKDILPKVADFTQDWLSNHILSSDKEYMQCFHEHGLK